jgi:PadR family transcriptional regulator PadR
MRADARKGQLDMLLLAVLDEAPAHGYLLIERLREASGCAFDLSEGTVYPALHRLERSGVLESSWDEASPRRRRVYAVAGNGTRDGLAGQGYRVPHPVRYRVRQQVRVAPARCGHLV